METNSPTIDSQTGSSNRIAKGLENKALRRLFDRIIDVSSLPLAALRIIQVADDESSGGTDLLREIEGDPAMAARIMRRVNSAYYGLHYPVADLGLAVRLLGYQEIRILALTTYVSRMFQESGDYQTYSRERLWNHLVSVGAASRLVAELCRQGNPEEAYLAGLLHDLGLILLDQNLRRHFCKVIAMIDKDTRTIDAEHEVFSFDHTQLGAFVAEKWSFPEQIVDAIRFHHEPEAYDGPHSWIVNTVAIANYLCSRYGLSSLGVENVIPPSAEIYAELGIDKNRLADIWDQLQPTLVSAEMLASP